MSSYSNRGGGSYSGDYPGSSNCFAGSSSSYSNASNNYESEYNNGGGDSTRFLLQEQKKINAELLDEMKQMQMQIRMMTSNMMNMNRGGNSVGGGMMGDGAAFSTNISSPGMWNSGQNFGGGFSGSSGFPNMGQGYRDDSGGGKMGGGMAGSRSVPYNMRVAKQPGDWDCPICGNMNFSRRNTCNGNGGQCGEEKKPEYVRLGVANEQKSTGRQGDWDCSKCGNLNYSHREKCNKCGVKKEEACASAGGGSSLIKPNGDWYCPRCNNMNFSYRTKCNRKECEFEKKDLPPTSNMDGGNGGPMNAMAMLWNITSMSNNMGMGGNSMGMGGGNMGNNMAMGGNMNGSNMGNMPGGSGGRMERGGKTAMRRHKGPEPREGDWECPRCYNLNFGTRDLCNGSKNNEPCKLKKPDFAKHGVKPWKNAATIKETDWDCWICGNVNFSSRDNCNRCKALKTEAQSDSLRLLNVKNEDA